MFGDSIAAHEYKVYARLLRKCAECGRVFDLSNESESAEWHYGHDCEV